MREIRSIVRCWNKFSKRGNVVTIVCVGFCRNLFPLQGRGFLLFCLMQYCFRSTWCRLYNPVMEYNREDITYLTTFILYFTGSTRIKRCRGTRIAWSYSCCMIWIYFWPLILFISTGRVKAATTPIMPRVMRTSVSVNALLRDIPWRGVLSKSV